MAIIVLEVTDDELVRAVEIEVLAYKNNVLSPIVAPGPFPPDAAQRRVNDLIEMRKNDPSTSYIQAFDEDAGKMIAFAKWHLYETPEAAAAAVRPVTIGPGRNKEACTLLYGGVAERKKELMGSRPHAYLHMLHTDPEFQGRGAGSMLGKWGTARADELGLPAYLESSARGHSLYKKLGFADLEVFEVDLTQFGGPIHQQPLMLREPSKLL